MERSERVFLVIQAILAGADLEDVAVELGCAPEILVAELEAELVAHGGRPELLGVGESDDLAAALAEIRALPETPDRDG